ncbi:GTP-binding protein TypA [Candidatus Beckwithbacteria bacterium RIFCSPHIGHO2_12_FULL_47_17]|uniref:50S ribosomal subunit assembly factor BipA n=1 Tax=Candidatus Beckwithbacteria bacterium RIFCSPHIGHO2_12_FULL_47_17 TaxID=1797460 RepID=A0A1F5DKG9_9BACT|nr:MAG: GTP-binding protein TypA [Candidatus Beckwithbacteria bacterium RIFCSPHIGHO2_12_FULL_47_17]
MDQAKIRNIAIIAHVDHGKTTLVDHLLKQSHAFAAHEAEMLQDTIMDTNELERERGVTILAKNTAINWQGYKINIIDTPGHADFSGEVERVLNMAEGCILLVDAAEGVLSQTRYVLSLALKLKLKPIVIINKVDRKDQRAGEVLNEINDLFLDLVEHENQLDFPVLYAVGRRGVVGKTVDLIDAKDLSLLFETIIKTIPAPPGDRNGPAQMQITTLDFDAHKGRYAIGRINRGTVKVGQSLAILRNDQKLTTNQVEYLFTFQGLKKTPVTEVTAGEIVAIAGFSDVKIGDTLTDPEHLEAMAPLEITQPILKIELSVSTSPLVGRDGKLTTSRQIQARLRKEIETNISLKIEPGVSGNSFVVAGRGELHLSILVETMRREGYEFSVSQPQVIYKKVDGKTHEPFEKLYLEVPEKYNGVVLNSLGQRKAEMVNMQTAKSGVRFEYKISTKNLIGLRGELLTKTSGMSVVNSVFWDFEPEKEAVVWQRNGAIVSNEPGKALAYAIAHLQVRATSFVNPGEEVYKGMIIGLNNRQGDMNFNICKGKQLTNMRASTSDATIQVSPALKMSLEQYLTFIGPDELLEVTPHHLRLRKKDLNFKR